MRKKLLLTFSFGRSSACMVDRILHEYGKTYEIIVLIANTGWEHEDSLRFGKSCSDRWAEMGYEPVWLEAVVHFGQKKACTHKVVTYETASRNQEPFIEVIKKYGIPNKGYPHCTRELKENVIKSFARAYGWPDATYETAIGIRGDEPKRLKRGLSSNGQIKIYPLADWFFMTKQDVLNYWADWVHDLRIPEHWGNCVACFRKSNGKLKLVLAEDSTAYDFPIEMEKKCGKIGSNKVRGVHVDTPRMFYRGEQTAEVLIASFKDI